MEINFTSPPPATNYAQEIANRLNGQDRILGELVGWAKETNALLSDLVKQQAQQQLLTQKLVEVVADLKSRL